MGVLVGIALTYIFYQVYPPVIETKSSITTPSPAMSETPTPPPTKPEDVASATTSTPTQTYSIDNIAPFIVTIDMIKYSEDILALLDKVKPLAVRITSSSDVFNYDKYLDIAKKISTVVQKNNQGLPLIAVDSEILFSKALPQFESQLTLAQLREEVDPYKITESGQNYASIARSLGIRMLLGPMIELFVPGKSDEGKKEFYFSDSTEILQLAGLSFVKGLINGGVIPVVKTFPAKTIAEKRQIDGREILIIDTPYSNEEELNQAISVLATWLFPFSESAREGVPAILISHTALPVLEKDSLVQPCTVSERIIQGLIREKWKYEGLLIAEDIAEYPLKQGETFSDVALRMIGAGIDILTTSITDEGELLKIAELIRNNLTEDSKNRINSRISSALSKAHPIETDIQYYQPQPPSQTEVTLIAKEETPKIQTHEVSALPEVQESHIPQSQEEIKTEEKTPESTPPESIQPAITTEPSPPAPTELPLPSDTQKTETTISPAPNLSETEETTGQPAATSQIQIHETPKTPESTENITSPPPKPQDKTPMLAQQKASAISPPPNTKPVIHKISPGETLFSIARRYGVTPKEIIIWNNIDNPNLIKHGFKLTIYVPEDKAISPQKEQPSTELPKPKSQPLEPMSMPGEENTGVGQVTAVQPPNPQEQSSETSPATTSPQTPQPTSQTPTETIIYTVKHGDTLDTISRDFRVSKEEIIQMNNLKKPYILPAGRKLRIPKIPKVGFNQ